MVAVLCPSLLSAISTLTTTLLQQQITHVYIIAIHYSSVTLVACNQVILIDTTIHTVGVHPGTRVVQNNIRVALRDLAATVTGGHEGIRPDLITEYVQGRLVEAFLCRRG